MRTLGRLLPLLGLLALFVVGMVLLFRMRLGAGDLYPRYSSHRADPLGTRLLHDSLQQLPGLRVERSLERIDKLGTGASRTFLLAGMTPLRWSLLSRESINSLDSAVRSGTRLVIVFEASTVYGKARPLPSYEVDEERRGSDKLDTAPSDKASPADKAPEKLRPGRNELGVKKPEKPGQPGEAGSPAQGGKAQVEDGAVKPEPVQADKDKAADKGKAAPTPAKPQGPSDAGYNEDEEDGEQPVDEKHPTKLSPKSFMLRQQSLAMIERLWGVELYGRLLMDKDLGALRSVGAPAGFPGRLPWKSCSYFELSKGSPWQVLYTRGSVPVMVEMRHGAGSIVLASDAHFISNEALQEAPALPVLSWLVGDSSKVIFDEVHLGLRKDKGLAMLARRYGLVPAMVLLLLAGLLFVWRQTVRFIPPTEEAEDLALEFHPTAGLEALLRRAVPMDKLYDTCLAEWRRHARPSDQERVGRLPGGRGARAYNAAVAILSRRLPPHDFKQHKTP